ncbi:MAG: hypothetical protein WCM93_14005, partial [Bacteroidota bacterium]
VTHILALENLIFIRCFTNATVNPSYDELLNNALAEKTYKEYTSELHAQIGQLPSASDRLEFIANEMERYSFLRSNYIIEESTFKPSVPRKIIAWFLIQKAFLEANLHIDPTKLTKSELPKIPTDLTVAELAFLFRALHDAKLMKPFHDEDLYRVIAAFFSSRNKEDISPKNIKNKFLSPDINAIDFWETGFSKLLKIATKIRQDFS